MNKVRQLNHIFEHKESIMNLNLADYDNDDHQDAQEFWIWLLNQLDENLGAEMKSVNQSSLDSTLTRKSESITVEDYYYCFWYFSIKKSWVYEYFGGACCSTIRCLCCESVNEREESFLALSLEVEPSVSI